MHQVVLRQCEVLASLNPTNITLPSNQRSESNMVIISLATEIAATVPQLASYEQNLATHPSPTATETPSQDWCQMPIRTSEPHFPQETLDGTVTAMSISQPPTNLLRTPPLTPSPPCISSSPNLTNQAPTSHFPTSTDSQRTHSLYHILYQLYTLRSISCLPHSMRDWVAGRITCMESTMDPLDLIGLQDTIRQRPSDGFPVNQVPEYVM
jgi:hypothetical protein